jgi:hypothetical protein
MEAIISALIAGGLSLVGVVITNNRGINKIQTDMKVEFAKAQAVTDTKIEALTSEVREHNNFAKRVPVLEAQVKRNTSDIADLSQYHKEPH